MRIAETFSHKSALNLSGILVILTVGVLSIYVVLNTARMPFVALLCATDLFLFALFISNPAQRSRNFLNGILWLEAAVIVTLYFLLNGSFIAILGIIWIVQAAELYGPRTAAWLLAGCVTIFTISQLYHWYGIDTFSAIISSIMMALFQVFALSTTVRAIGESQLREEAGTLNRELIATRELLSQTTRLNERLRIARDLHDILGHHMTALTLNLEVAKHSTDGKAQEKVEQSLALAKLLLSDLRTAVSELRENDAIDIKQSVNKLVADIPNLEITVDFDNAPVVKDVDIAETLLRCTQEAMTNVLRHSNASKCNIELSGLENKLLLVVTDNGTGANKISPGNGLIGMRERVDANGGSLSWGQNKEGFSLSVQLPMEATL